jgi:hypothetical protein
VADCSVGVSEGNSMDAWCKDNESFSIYGINKGIFVVHHHLQQQPFSLAEYKVRAMRLLSVTIF